MAEPPPSINAPPREEAENSRRVIRNIFGLGGGEVLSRGIGFIATAYLARVLGPEGFGIIGFAAAFFGYAALAVSAGFDSIGAREVARRPQEAANIAMSVIQVRLLLAFIALAVIGTMALLLDKPFVVKLVMMLMALSFVSLALNTAWVYKGLEQSRRILISLMMEQALYLSLILLIVKDVSQIAIVPIAQFCGAFIAALWLAFPLFRSLNIRPNLQAGLEILRSSRFLILSRVFRALIFTFDIVLIGLLLGEREVGLYTAPYRVCLLILAIAAAIHVAYLPGMTRAWTEGIAGVNGVLGRSLGLSAAIAAPLVIGGMVLAIPLMVTMFGPGYEASAEPFRLLILSIGLVFINGAFRNVLIIGDRMRADMWVIGAAAALNVGLNLIVVRRYGILGAACTTALAEATILLLAVIVIRKAGITPKFSAIWRPILAAAIMGACLLALGATYHLTTDLALGALIYLVALLALRGVPEDAQPHL